MFKVYVHTNKINSKKYVGVTNNIENRWRNKGIAYKPYTYESSFWNAICKYGWDNFNHEIIFETLEKKEAYEKEIEFIKKFKTQNRKFGYNISPGGNGGKIYKTHPRGMKGKKHTEEKNKKHSEFLKQKENNCMTNGSVIWGKTHKHPRGMKGKKHTEKLKENMRKKLKEISPTAVKVKVIFPDGKEIIFDNKEKCASYLNISSTGTTFLNLCKTGEPFKISKFAKKDFKEKAKNIIGIVIKELENTEVKHS